MTHRGYIGQVFEVRPILAAMEDRGMPIDDAARLALDAEFLKAQSEVGQELMTAFPESAKRKEPYKRFPPELRVLPESEWGNLFREDDKTDKRGRVKAGKWYRYGQREVPEAVLIDGNLTTQPALRWCCVWEFNPNSGPMLIEYMKSKGHKVPKSRKSEDADGNPKDTTEKKELIRLSQKTGDAFYLKVIEYREFSKMRGTYIEGFKPGPDGRVHATFTFDTSTGQLAARNPNVTNFPKRMRLAKQLRTMVAAPPGQILVEWDYRSYHVLTTGFCAEDPEYCRMARLDMHSFVAWHLLKLPGADALMSLSDTDLAERFAWFKSDPARKWVRDNQSKPAGLGIGFGMSYRRLFQENLEYFKGEKDAKRLYELLQALFPRVFAWQDRIRMKAHQDRQLISPFGHIRRFYEVFQWDIKRGGWTPGDQSEEAIAFLPANIAFGNIRLTMKELGRRHLDSLYGLCNSVHDSLVFCFPERWLEQHVADVYPVLTAPSPVLRHPMICPEGLVVGVEGNCGLNWSTMHEIPLPKAPIDVVPSEPLPQSHVQSQPQPQ